MSSGTRATVGTRRRVGVATLVVATLVAVVPVAAACGDDAEGRATDRGPNPTTHDPGPNPTTHDPGPNDTSQGPHTVRGTLDLDPATGCVTLETESGTLGLALVGYRLDDDEDGRPALVVVDDGTPIASSGDTMIVAGYPGTEQDACGARFDVDSVVNVTPPS